MERAADPDDPSPADPRRLAYAWVVGAALWGGWLLSVGLGSGGVDLAGQVIGTDYLQGYTAGVTLRLGEGARLYDFAYQSALQQAIIGPRLQDFHAFITPPFLAWLFVPLSAFPYPLSFALWSLIGLLCLGASLRLLAAPHAARVFAWSLTWFAVFSALTFGQNSLLSLALLSLTYGLWRKGRLWLAGLAASLLLYKPQLLVGVGLLWLWQWRRDGRALLGLAAGGAVLLGLSLWQLPAASRAYVGLSRTLLPHLTEWAEFPTWHLHTLRGFWHLLWPRNLALADALWLVGSALGVAGCVHLWRRGREQPALLFAAATVLTLWVAPHGMIYDWTLLLLPAVLLWQHQPRLRPRLKVAFAAIWAVSLISGPLTFWQMQTLPLAVQISVPVGGMVVYSLYSALRDPESEGPCRQGATPAGPSPGRLAQAGSSR